MDINILKKIQAIEDLLLDNSKGGEIQYKKFGKTWIRADRPFVSLKEDTLNFSELQVQPNWNMTNWGIWFLSLFKKKKEPILFHNLLGIQLLWKSQRKRFLPCRADIIYDRGSSIILVYASLQRPFVIKLAISEAARQSLQSETQAQKRAFEIKSQDIVIPEILKECYEEELFFIAETYFKGKKQSFDNSEKLQRIFGKVFDFLLEFYLANPIELKGLTNNRYLDNPVVENFISNQKYGISIIDNFRKLKSKDLKLISGIIHGDLSHNNILTNHEEICIIDWGKSKTTFLARDLDNSSFDTKGVFEELIKQGNLPAEELYTYHEQIFLENYIELNRKLYKWLIWKKKSSNFNLWINSQIQRCYESANKI